MNIWKTKKRELLFSLFSLAKNIEDRLIIYLKYFRYKLLKDNILKSGGMT